MLLLEIFGFVLASALGGWLLSLVVNGVRTGRIRHSNATSTYSFRHEPVRFCFVVLVFYCFQVVCYILLFCEHSSSGTMFEPNPKINPDAAAPRRLS